MNMRSTFHTIDNLADVITADNAHEVLPQVGCPHCDSTQTLDVFHEPNNNSIGIICRSCGKNHPLSARGIMWLRQSKPKRSNDIIAVMKECGFYCYGCGNDYQTLRRHKIGMHVHHTKPFAEHGEAHPKIPTCAVVPRTPQRSTASHDKTAGRPSASNNPQPQTRRRLIMADAIPLKSKTTGEATPIAKPAEFSLAKFKSKRNPEMANVETLLNGLPHHKISEAGDFVRLHSNVQRYWSDELCFVNVPIKGAKKAVLHLIDEDLAMQYLESAVIKRFRLALATKPDDKFFLCHVPTRNLDNRWNETVMDGLEKAKSFWVKVTSRGDEGVEEYKTTCAREQDAFPDPQWPTQSIDELIAKSFEGRMIDRADHPGLLRLLGAKPVIS